MIQFSRPVRSSPTQTDASRAAMSTIFSAIIAASTHRHSRSHWCGRTPATGQRAVSGNRNVARPNAAGTSVQSRHISSNYELYSNDIPRASKAKPGAIPANQLQQPRHLCTSSSPTHPHTEGRGLPATARTESNISHQQGRVVSGRKRHVHQG